MGGLVGSNWEGTIRNSYAAGNVNPLSGATGLYAGGLAGNNAYGMILDSYASGKVRGNYGVGGLVGENASNSGEEINRSFAVGDVEGSGADSQYIGGLVGYGAWGIVENSYASGKVSGDEYVGGLVGDNGSGEIRTSYSIGEVTGSGVSVGGLVGSGNGGSTVNSFYDIATSGYSTSVGGSGLSTAAMKSQSSYEADAANAWDFAAIWGVDPALNDGYPYLQGSLVELQYDDNGSTGGTAPASQSYVPVTAVSISGAMDLVKAGYTFAGWNEKANGSGTTYAAGSSYTMWSDATLFAQWVAAPLSTDATLTSTIGTVSTGGTASERITGVPYGTTLAAFKAAITPATGATLEVYEADGVTVATVLTSGDKVTVTAEDGTTQVTYTVTVVAAPQSTDATLTSTIGKVSTGGTASETITGVPYGTTLAAFKAAIMPAVGATFEVYEADGVTVATVLASGDKVIVTAEDGTTQATYTVTVDGAPPSTGVGGGGGSPAPSDNKLTLKAGQAGELSLFDEITVTVPANASDKEVIITIDKTTDPQKLLSDNDVLLSSIFDVLKNISDDFKNPVTITIKYNSASLPKGQVPAVFAYDETKKVWVKVMDGKISGDRVSVQANSLGKFAVFAVEGPAKPTTEDEPSSNFSDVEGHWAEADIFRASRLGIVSGYPDGSFQPNRIVTRAEFAVMLMNALRQTDAGSELPFSDTAKIGNWAKNAVALAAQAGYIKGYQDGTFRPDSAIARAEMAMMVANVLGLSSEAGLSTDYADDQAIPAWAKGAIAAIQGKDIMTGKPSGEFDPDAKSTRAEAVTVLLRLLDVKNG